MEAFQDMPGGTLLKVFPSQKASIKQDELMPIDYEKELNPAQLQAVMHMDSPLLVIAGAGSGKTRTIVYRLAHLVERGVPPWAILLLTFTRKASQEMLQRASRLLGEEGASDLGDVKGGTFHSFAYRALRRTPPPGYANDFTIMDRPDAEAAIRELKAELGLGKGDRSYPKTGTVVDILSKSRNKELGISDVMARESFHLAGYAEDFDKFAKAYAAFKQKHNLLDYDDLLFQFEALLLEREDVRESYRRTFQHIMIDEYQDTNLVQARLVKLLEPLEGRVMAVGDDAQSIYAFRGANVRNILEFPETFPGTRIVKLEQNYRSRQNILNLTNRILDNALAHYEKELFTERGEGSRPELLRPLSDRTQATVVVDKILEMLRQYPPSEVAVLFRAGYQSFHLETQLARLGLAFQKFGGMRFSEAAHVKDVLGYLRCVRNPGDRLAWQRIAGHVKGVGQKTAIKVHDALLSGDRARLESVLKRNSGLRTVLDKLHEWREATGTPAALVERVFDFYKPILQEVYPDDYPKREKGIEELIQIAATYRDLDQLLADLCLETPEQREREDALTLSTIHQAKGLEWGAVVLIDLVEDRFPSRHAMNSSEDYEEERRLLYVACTRAKDYLALSAPRSVFKRGQEMADMAAISPFIRELPPTLFQELQESHYGGRPQPPRPEQKTTSQESTGPSPKLAKGELPFCRHKIFGRGKIVSQVAPDKYRVNFPGFGLKVILADYLELES